MANAKKNYKDKYYRVSKRIDGKLKQFYGSSKKDAEAKRDAYVKQLELGIDPELAMKRLGEALKEWFDTVGILGLKSSSKERYLATYNNHIKMTDLGAIRLSDISRMWLQRYFNESELSHGQVDATKKLLSKFFTFAVADGYVLRNPVTGIRNPKPKNSEEKEIFTIEEIKKILSIESRHSCQIKMLLYTGMRLGESLALTWDDIDLEKRTILVNKAYDQRGRLTTPKTTTSKRLFAFPDHMISDLKVKELQNKAEKVKRGFELSNLVFPSETGTPLNQRNFRRAYEKILVEAGVEYRPPHTLRHTFTTSAQKLGIAIEDVAKMLGHSSINTTREIYTHYDSEDLRKLVNKLFDGEQ